MLRHCDFHALYGDFNQPNLFWTRANAGHVFPDPIQSSFPSHSSALLDGMALLDMRQMNALTNYRNRTLDLVFVNEEAVNNCEIMEALEPLIKVDPNHPPFCSAFQFPRLTQFEDLSDDRAYNFFKTDFVGLSQEISRIDWTNIENIQDVDDAVSVFNENLQTLFRTYVPPPVPRRKPPWSNNRLRKLKRQRAAALRKYSFRRNARRARAFFAASNAYKNYSRYLYSVYVHRTQRNLKRSPRHFWSFVNEKRKETGLPAGMFLGDTTSSNIEHTCNLFAEHFSSVFNKETATAEQVDNAVQNVPSNVSNFASLSFSREDIKSACRRLKASSSAGPDGIPSIILRNCAEALAEPLQILFNKSITSERFPECWKKSYMFPVFKKGNKRDISNYRGITSLCACSKLLEILVCQSLMQAAKTYISTDQHGFFPGRSTNTNLVEFTSFCVRNMEGGGQVDAVYTDLKAAFDRVDHRILLAKLERLGTSISLIRWFASFLSRRSLIVKLGASESRPFWCFSGVPQGSNIGPSFFLVYFNDVGYILPRGCRLLYADDLKLFHIIRGFEDCQHLQQMIDSFVAWCATNMLSLSTQKCSVISFTRKKQPYIWPYNIRDIPLERVTAVKDLGVILDSKLTFGNHHSYVLAKANRNLGFMMRMCREFYDLACLRALFCALVRCHLEYAVIVWCPFTELWKRRIESVQSKFTRFAIRLCAQPDPAISLTYEERCSTLGMASLASRRTYLRASFIGKLLLGGIDAPNILARINFNAIPRPIRNRSILRANFQRTTYGQNEPIRAMCVVFNSMYHIFDFSMTSEAFLYRLRNELFGHI